MGVVSDKEGWQASRLLGALLELTIRRSLFAPRPFYIRDKTYCSNI
jgi:hypothetical protein